MLGGIVVDAVVCGFWHIFGRLIYVIYLYTYLLIIGIGIGIGIGEL